MQQPIYCLTIRLSKAQKQIAVWQAQNSQGETCVIKILPQPHIISCLSHAQQKYAFSRQLIQTESDFFKQREQQKYPHFVQCIEQFSNKQGHYLVLQHYSGDLEQWLSKHNSIPLEQTLDWVLQIIAAIQQLHQSDYIYRDLKAANILIDQNAGQLHLSDFATVLKLNYKKSIMLEHAMGTPQTMAPEQLIAYAGSSNHSSEQANNKYYKLDYRCDYYALGHLLYRLISGAKTYTLQQQLVDSLYRSAVMTNPGSEHIEFEQGLTAKEKETLLKKIKIALDIQELDSADTFLPDQQHLYQRLHYAENLTQWIELLLRKEAAQRPEDLSQLKEFLNDLSALLKRLTITPAAVSIPPESPENNKQPDNNEKPHSANLKANIIRAGFVMAGMMAFLAYAFFYKPIDKQVIVEQPESNKHYDGQLNDWLEESAMGNIEPEVSLTPVKKTTQEPVAVKQPVLVKLPTLVTQPVSAKQGNIIKQATIVKPAHIIKQPTLLKQISTIKPAAKQQPLLIVIQPEKQARKNQITKAKPEQRISTLKTNPVKKSTVQPVAVIKAPVIAKKELVIGKKMDKPITPVTLNADSQIKETPSVLKKYFSDQLTTNQKGPQMRIIPAGDFIMGSNGSHAQKDEKPSHTVQISTFYLSDKEISFAQYYAYCEAQKTYCPELPHWANLNHPVVNINKDEAIAYTRWLSQKTNKPYRLPSEAEWEYSAYAGRQENFWWGSNSPYTDQIAMINMADVTLANKVPNKKMASSYNDHYAYSSPTGSFPENPLGLFDMNGNVWEWVADCAHKNYHHAPTNGLPWMQENGGYCQRGVSKGGSWFNSLKDLRLSKRQIINKDRRLNNLGFRVAMSLISNDIENK